jgi:hypothetical protein
MSKRAWLKLLLDNRRTITSLAKEGFNTWRSSRRKELITPVNDNVLE